jgi:hypothetical protein
MEEEDNPLNLIIYSKKTDSEENEFQFVFNPLFSRNGLSKMMKFITATHAENRSIKSVSRSPFNGCKTDASVRWF